MTEKEAYSILGVHPENTREEMKRRYRQLISQVHPDVCRSDEEHLFTAQEINDAYSYLVKGKGAVLKEKRQKKREEKEKNWNAPVNPYAYVEREIYHYVEDSDGDRIGTFCIARGKYLWDPEIEDFSLFLLSMQSCSGKLIERIHGKMQFEVPLHRQKKFQAELSYLLSQQFLDMDCMEKMVKNRTKDLQGKWIYELSAMLELLASVDEKMFPKVGDHLIPSKMQAHKLYLKNEKGQELGYLSFPDDRIYYLMIPLFEQRRVQVKIIVEEKKQKKMRSVTEHFACLRMWVREKEIDNTALQESVTSKIERLFYAYTGTKSDDRSW